MTEDADFDLALELLALKAAHCKHWKFLAGMAVWIVQPDGAVERGRIIVEPGLTASDGWADLTDPASMGCLLALVRTAWEDPDMTPTFNPAKGVERPWHIRTPNGRMGPYREEVEALVLALEAAP